MKKIFLAVLLVASLGVCGYSRDVRVVLKNGLERKGELTATNEDSVFIKFKNGKVRKIPFAEITSVLDVKTKADILDTIRAEGKAPAEETPAAEEPPAAAAAPAAPEAADSAPQKPVVRVVLKTGLERKGILTASNEDSVFIKFKNGKTRKIPFAEITSVIDTKTNKDILSSIQAGSTAAAEEAPAAEETAAAEEAPVAAKAPAAVKAPAVEEDSAVLEAADTLQPKALKQKGLPDNLMGWMSARYGTKAMLGMKWETPVKAKEYYACATAGALTYVKPKQQAPLLVKVIFWPYFVIKDTMGSRNSGKKSGGRGSSSAR